MDMQTYELLLRGAMDTNGNTELLVAADAADELGLENEGFILREIPRFVHCPTGSRVYSTPKEDSDWDWVVLYDQFVWKIGEWAIRAEFGPKKRRRGIGWNRHNPYPTHEGEPYYNPSSPSLLTAAYRFGRINVILAPDADMFGLWKHGADMLRAQARARDPLGMARPTREDAVRTF